MTTDQWGKGRYLKKEVERAFMRENELFDKTHVFVIEKNKKKIPKGAVKNWGHWKQLRNKYLKDYLKTKKENQKYYY